MEENIRSRIEEEEAYRARVRQQLEAETRRENRPSYWTGFILNLVVVGLGHLTIGEAAWGIVWFVLAIVLGAATGLIAIPFVWVGVLIHYRNIYVRKFVSA